jgi:hypothetical protein
MGGTEGKRKRQSYEVQMKLTNFVLFQNGVFSVSCPKRSNSSYSWTDCRSVSKSWCRSPPVARAQISMSWILQFGETLSGKLWSCAISSLLCQSDIIAYIRTHICIYIHTYIPSVRDYVWFQYFSLFTKHHWILHYLHYIQSVRQSRILTVEHALFCLAFE